MGAGVGGGLGGRVGAGVGLMQADEPMRGASRPAGQTTQARAAGPLAPAPPPYRPGGHRPHAERPWALAWPYFPTGHSVHSAVPAALRCTLKRPPGQYEQRGKPGRGAYRPLGHPVQTLPPAGNIPTPHFVLLASAAWSTCSDVRNMRIAADFRCTSAQKGCPIQLPAQTPAIHASQYTLNKYP